MATHMEPLNSSTFSPNWETFTANGNRNAEYYNALAEASDDVFFRKLGFTLFPKEELYTAPKAIRMIANPPDSIKGVFGMVFQQIEKHFFSLPTFQKFFVKKIPVKDRATVLEGRFKEHVFITDFSSFESHHRGWLARAVKFILFRLLGENCPREFRIVMSRLLSGTDNVLTNKKMGNFAIHETLMSGMPWTSLNNCILNFLLIGYLKTRDTHPNASAKELASLVLSLNFMVEGDDGISEGRPLDTGLIAKLGLNLKNERHPNCSVSKFCGIMKARDTADNLTDPVVAFTKFFYMPSKYLLASSKTQKCLLRAKALSYVDYINCPLLGQLVACVLKMTHGCTPNTAALSYWQM